MKKSPHASNEVYLWVRALPKEEYLFLDMKFITVYNCHHCLQDWSLTVYCYHSNPALVQQKVESLALEKSSKRKKETKDCGPNFRLLCILLEMIITTLLDQFYWKFKYLPCLLNQGKWSIQPTENLTSKEHYILGLHFFLSLMIWIYLKKTQI